MLNNSLLNKAKQLEKQLYNYRPQARVLFFDSEAEFEEAEKNGDILPSDICFIDDYGD